MEKNFYLGILIKHLPKKNFDESSIKEILHEYFTGAYEPKILKKKKMVKRVKIFNKNTFFHKRFL